MTDSFLPLQQEKQFIKAPVPFFSVACAFGVIENICRIEVTRRGKFVNIERGFSWVGTKEVYTGEGKMRVKQH